MIVELPMDLYRLHRNGMLDKATPKEIRSAARQHADYEAAQRFFDAILDNLGVSNLAIDTDEIVNAALGATNEKENHV